MVGVQERGEPAPVAHDDLGLTVVLDPQITRGAEVALAVRGTLEQLTAIAEVLGGDGDVAAPGGHDERLERLGAGHHPTMGRRGRDQHVVAVSNVE